MTTPCSARARTASTSWTTAPGERRAATLADARDGLTLVDALPNMDFGMSMFLPSDVDPAMADRHQMAIMLERTTKPLVVVTYDVDAMRDAIAMAEAVAGGADALRERPTIALYINVTRGLVHNGDSLRKLLILAERGLPALWIPVTSGGTTGPVTMAGNVALNNAGVLVGIVLAQLVREGTPVVVPGFGGDALDLRTMVDPYAEPDHRGMVALARPPLRAADVQPGRRQRQQDGGPAGRDGGRADACWSMRWRAAT